MAEEVGRAQGQFHPGRPAFSAPSRAYNALKEASREVEAFNRFGSFAGLQGLVSRKRSIPRDGKTTTVHGALKGRQTRGSSDAQAPCTQRARAVFVTTR